MGWFQDVFGRAEAARSAEKGAPEERGSPSKPRSPERLASVNLDRYLNEHPRAVIDVWAPWCGPCRAFAPVFAEAAAEWGERVGFGKVHADHEPSLVARFGIRSIPSLLFFREGRLVRTEVGVISAARLAKLLHKVFRDLP